MHGSSVVPSAKQGIVDDAERHVAAAGVLAENEDSAIESATPGCAWIDARLQDGALQVEADLSRQPPLSSAEPQRALDALRLAARGVARLHAQGAVHGDLRPDTLRMVENGVAVIVVRGGPTPTQFLVSRLRGGAPLGDVAFAAPEVVRGEAATPASDVFSLAALAVFAVTGQAPLGRVDASALGDLGAATRTVLAALHPSPARRPNLQELQDALAQGASEHARSLPSMLNIVLGLAGAFVFAGVLALTLRQWEDAGAAWRLTALLGFTFATAAMGLLLGRLGFARSGGALALLALQLTWADAYYMLSMLGQAESYAAWALAAAAVGVLHCGVAAIRRSLVVGVSGVTALSIASLSLGLVVTSPLEVAALGYALGVSAAYAWFAALMAGRVLALPFTVGAAVGVATACVLSVALSAEHPALLALPYAGAVAAYLAARYSPHPAVLRRTALGIVLCAPVLQLATHWSVWALFAAAFGYAALHRLLAVRASKEAAPASQVAPRVSGVFLAVVGVVAAAAAVVHFADAGPGEAAYFLGLIGPYLVIAALLAASGRLAPTCGALLLGITPSLQAMLAYASPYATWGCIAIGSIALWRSERTPAARHWLWVGAANIALAPMLLTAWATLGHGADELFTVAFDPGAAVEWSRTRAAYVITLLGAVVLLVRASLARRSIELEVAALVTFFLPVLLASVALLKTDLFYAALSLLGGGSLLTLGVLRRRALLSIGSALGLLTVLSIQYFAKLSTLVPWSALALAFGVTLFGLGIVFEKRLKALLPTLRQWD